MPDKAERKNVHSPVVMAVAETGHSARVQGIYGNLKGSQWDRREEIEEKCVIEDQVKDIAITSESLEAS